MSDIGVASDLRALMRGNMFTDGAPYQIGGINRDNIEYYSSYDFNLSWSTQNFPKINLDLHYGSDEVRWDVSGPLLTLYISRDNPPLTMTTTSA